MAKRADRPAQSLQADGLAINYVEAGTGAPIIVFGADHQSEESALKRLADAYRLVFLHPPVSDHHSSADLGAPLPRALNQLDIKQCSVIGIASGASPALSLALAAEQRVDKLVLLSPEIADTSLDLGAVDCATLVLVGTGDSPGVIEAGRLCRERIRSSHLSFVYGARNALSGERHDAWLEPVEQFLREGEQFIIFHQSQIIRP